MTCWHIDVIWRHWSWSTLVQVRACYLTAPMHYLKQFWHLISELLWHWPEPHLNIKTVFPGMGIPGADLGFQVRVWVWVWCGVGVNGLSRIGLKSEWWGGGGVCVLCMNIFQIIIVYIFQIQYISNTTGYYNSVYLKPFIQHCNNTIVFEIILLGGGGGGGGSVRPL